jgi:hypothetical protein
MVSLLIEKEESETKSVKVSPSKCWPDARKRRSREGKNFWPHGKRESQGTCQNLHAAFIQQDPHWKDAQNVLDQ